MELNDSYSPRAWIVDNFYKDPYKVREYALSLEYYDMHNNDGGYVGFRTRTQHLFPGLKERFEQIMNKPITRWQEYGMNGRFQYGPAGTWRVYHCDDQRYAGMLYLTPDAPVECGTTLFMDKRTKVRHNSDPNIMASFQNGTTLDKTQYQEVDVLGNVFNRLVLFDAGCLHSASDYFGSNISNCRLWQIFFFDA